MILTDYSTDCFEIMAGAAQIPQEFFFKGGLIFKNEGKRTAKASFFHRFFADFAKQYCHYKGGEFHSFLITL